MKTLVSGLILVALLTLPQTASALSINKFSPPFEVNSPNRTFVLVVDPRSNNHYIYRASKRTTSLWSFSEAAEDVYLLSNDGEVVVSLHAPYVHVNHVNKTTCITMRRADGVFKTFAMSEICPDPEKTNFHRPPGRPGGMALGLPEGDSWRTWRGDVVQGDHNFRVNTTGRIRCWDFSLDDGQILGHWSAAEVEQQLRSYKQKLRNEQNQEKIWMVILWFGSVGLLVAVALGWGAILFWRNGGNRPSLHLTEAE
jgi:hypothetical protein